MDSKKENEVCISVNRVGNVDIFMVKISFVNFVEIIFRNIR